MSFARAAEAVGASDRHIRFSVDTGGTFTDVVAIDELTGAIYMTKTATTPNDPSQGVIEAMHKVAAQAGCNGGNASALIHGTTTATNAVLQRDFSRLGLVVTRGMRHVLEIARQSVPDGYGNSYFWVKPPRLVTLERVCEVGGRLAPNGSEIDPLALDDIESAAATFRYYCVDCIAVCLLHSYANDEHERRVVERLQKLMPDAFVSRSSLVLPEYREYERSTTTILDALVKPYVRDYLVRAEDKLVQEAGSVPFMIMQSNGGVASAAEVAKRPITTLVSGPAAGVLAATFIGERAGFRNLLTLDAGGTSTDVCLIEDLRPLVTTETKLDVYPVKTPMLDIVAVGTGGGSIAWVTNQGGLKVGPISAGAVPGPMCYGKGGTEPTVTDANLVLGRIPPHLLGGEVPLDRTLAREGVEELAATLGLGVEEAAAGVLEIAAWNQANGIRRVSVERGHDPRDYCLVAFGGAGGLLAGDVADALGIATVLVPPDPGNVSALGLQVSDLRRDYVRTLVRSQDAADPTELEQVWLELEMQGSQDLLREGINGAAIRLLRSVDARYVGEAHECSVLLTDRVNDEAALDELWERFHSAHERMYGFAYRGTQTVEVVNLRVQAVGGVRRPTPTERHRRVAGGQPTGERSVHVGGDWTECRSYQREALPVGAEVVGPAVVEEYGATLVVFPEWRAVVDPDLNLIMTRPVR
jgi:N-methylhydantoinase A